jgi:spermidine synthase
VSNNNTKEVLFYGHIDGHAVQIDREEQLLSLHFNNGLIESQIDTTDSSVLPLIGNRQMLSCLMFGHAPQKVMLVGCGGGSIARWFNNHLPDTQGIALEQSATIINLALRYFQFPSAQDSWQIVQAEAQHYLQNHEELYDLIIVDIEVNQQTPDWVSSEAFLLNCQRLLTVNGAININLIADTPELFAQQLWPIRQVFAGLTYCHASNANNIFVTAFKTKPNTSDLQTRAEAAEKQFGIEFSLFYRELLRDNPANSGVF